MAFPIRAIVLLLFFIPFHLASAQKPREPTGAMRPSPFPQRTFSLGGRVLYGDNMEIAPRIAVRLLGSQGALVGIAFTDNRGQFEFDMLPRSVYFVEVQEEDYQPVRVRVDLHLGSRHDTTILLKRKMKVVESEPAGPSVSVRELKIPPKARKAFEKGMRELHEKKQAKLSLAHFRKAIQIYPDYDAAYVQLGLAHLEQADFVAARQVLEKAGQVNPKNAEALELLGYVYNHEGEPRQAVQVLEQALQQNADSWLANMELGKSWLRLKKLDEANQYARRAHELNPLVPPVHLLLYNVCIARKDYQTALTVLDEFLERFPDNSLAPKVRQQRDLMRETLAANPK